MKTDPWNLQFSYTQKPQNFVRQTLVVIVSELGALVVLQPA
jgi:hypothetical protein